MLVTAFFGTIAACDAPADDTGTDDTGEPLPPLAPPSVAVASPTSSDSFKSTCTASVELTDPSSTVVANIVVLPFKGGRWGSTPIDPGVQLVATLTWSDCENTDKGSGSFTSSTFSGESGDLFLLHYDGVDAGFEWMVQREEFAGGAAHVLLAAGASQADVATFAESIGVSAEADGDDPTYAALSWTDATSVASVLTNAGASSVIAWSEPAWLEKPAWW